MDARPIVALLVCSAFVSVAPAQAAGNAPESRLGVISWNMQSNIVKGGRVRQESDSRLLADQMREKRGISLWGLSEVFDSDAAERFRRAASDAAGGASFGMVLGEAPEHDRLAILYEEGRLALEHDYELGRVQLGRSGLRPSLVARFRERSTGQRFLFMVNHLIRGGDNARDRSDHLQQVRLLNDWTLEEDLPIIAVGDYNFDVDIDTLRGKPPFHEMVDGAFHWVRPTYLVKTQAADGFETVLDFVFVANERFAPGWSAQSTIMNRSRDTPAQRMDFGDDRRNSDHRPVRATFTFVRPDEADDDAALESSDAEQEDGDVAVDTGDVNADDETVQVGSFNIELLGSARRPFEGERDLRTTAEIRQLADLIAVDHDLEVVVLQEIDTGSEQWHQLATLLAEEGWEFFEGTTSGRKQFVVLGWDADEVSVDVDSLQELDIGTRIERPNGGCEAEGLRLPVAGRFRAGAFEFWVVGVHLKSRVGDEPCTDYVRAEQCRRIVEQVDALIASSGEDDVLLVGDFNQRSGHASLDPLAEAGFRSQMDFLAPGSARGSYVKAHRPTWSRDLIDHVFLRIGDTAEVVRYSGFVHGFESDEEGRAFVHALSDHVPVHVSFHRVDRD